MVETKDQELDHEYDGIREYDNPTPGWWHAIFVLTAVFAVFYAAFWHFSPLAWSQQQVLADEELAATKKQFAELGGLKADEATMVKMMKDPKWLPMGAAIFRSNCVSCHGDQGQGGVICPNLTDDYWKNIKRIEEIPRVVANGARNGAMPPWKGPLNDNEIVLVSAYVASLRGSNPPGARGPEGDKVDPWPTGAAQGGK
jgi:cytochrome c oxidase cbb3-type subunit 3